MASLLPLVPRLLNTCGSYHCHYPQILRGFGYGSELFLASAGILLAPPVLVLCASRKAVLRSRGAMCCVASFFISWLAFMFLLVTLHLSSPLVDDPATFGRSLLPLADVMPPCKVGCSPGLR